MSQAATAAPPSTGSTSAALWGLRAAALAHVAVLTLEFVTAGQLMSQNFAAMSAHSTGALVLHVAAGLQLVAAVLLWRPGRGSPLPMVLSAAAFALGFAQAYFGSHGMLGLHVPAALALVVLVVWVLALAWTRQGPARSRP
ncbi:hypothetical protein [Actinorugispora endophytica]|uniref:DUF423 domain-containing protein n=1 Tax=Actinorugispora endophytica TaxID=1605990 RepID=A0A4R6UQQ5_9ACTN|nr:hypothetical protein [Actinorugispora endophytica]TDQ47595.1 hypothetical protein EV190_12163 [Actinorugispora endophytica]